MDVYGDLWSCEYAIGVMVDIRSDAEGEVVDPGALVRIVQLEAGFIGTTSEGVGMGVRPSCFFDALGLPDQVVLGERPRDVWVVGEASWKEYGLQIRDGVWPVFEVLADGSIDDIRFIE